MSVKFIIHLYYSATFKSYLPSGMQTCLYHIIIKLSIISERQKNSPTILCSRYPHSVPPEGNYQASLGFPISLNAL
jgi:hypothetical protein